MWTISSPKDRISGLSLKSYLVGREIQGHFQNLAVDVGEMHGDAKLQWGRSRRRLRAGECCGQ